MDFYKSISAYYDELFPASRDTVAFLNRCSKPFGCILDLACGTGNHVWALAQHGHRVTGIDLDEEMISVARKKRIYGVHVDFHVGNMLRFEEYYRAQDSPDLVYCIGNSVVHLSSERDISILLSKVYAFLTPGGTLVVQIVNFDRILQRGIFELPTLRVRKGVESLDFQRTYRYKTGEMKVTFESELTVRERARERKIANAIPLLILKSETLASLTAEAGFRNIVLLGSFREAPFNLESHPLILTAKK